MRVAAVQGRKLVLRQRAAGGTKAIYACLYGDADTGGVSPLPAWSPFLQVLQNLLSAVLIYLFLFGVRNQFKIK